MLATLETIRVQDDATAAAPRLSVVIPTYNRAATLSACLEALSKQTCGHELFEIIVADDGSADNTGEIVDRYTRKAPPCVRYVRQPNTGANAARNRAIRSTRAPLVLLINDDVLAAPEMVGRHIATHEQHPDDRVAVLGRVTIAPAFAGSRLAQLHLDFAYERLGDATELDWHSFFTCNVSFKKSLLDRGGYFEERIRYHEDLELAERLSHHGLRIIYAREALGYHHHLLTEEEFLAIAAREARALAVWAQISPRVRPTLGELGFEPELPLASRAKHHVLTIAFDGPMLPLWRAVARGCPPQLNKVSLRIYSQMYQSVRRNALRRELRTLANEPAWPIDSSLEEPD